MSYKAVLFDMDGTLLDTLEDLRDSTNHVLRQMGYPERSLGEMRTARTIRITARSKHGCTTDFWTC